MVSVRRYTRGISLPMLFVCIIAYALTAQEAPRLAVIPFQPIEVSDSDAIIVSGLFETGLVKTESFQVLEQSRIKEILEVQAESLSGCYDESCAVELGKLLSAEQIAMGTLARAENTYVLNARIIDVMTGKNLVADTLTVSSFVELTEAATKLAFMLAGLTYTSSGDVQVVSSFSELFVRTQPAGAEIFINGVKKGTSPDLFKRVPVGSVLVEARKGGLYARKQVQVEERATEVSLELSIMTGNLFIKSTEPDVHVYLDQLDMGPLGDGFFTDIIAGTYMVSLRGLGIHWSREIEIIPNMSVRIEAEPRVVGGLVYNLPEGVVAVIQGDEISRELSGKGEMGDIPVGRYRIELKGGERYEDRLDVVEIGGGETVVYIPETKQRREFEEKLFRERLAGLESMLFGPGKIIWERDLQSVRDFIKTIEGADQRHAAIILQAEALLRRAEERKAGVERESQLQELYARRDEINAAIEAKLRSRKGAAIAGLTFMGIGVVSGGAGGISFGIASSKYDAYQSTVLTSEAEKLHRQIKNLDTFFIIGVSAGGVSLLTSLIITIALPKTGDLEGELTTVNARIAGLEAAQ